MENIISIDPIADKKIEIDPNTALTINKLSSIPKKEAPVETTGIVGIDRSNGSASPSAMIQKVKFEESAGKDINKNSSNGIPLIHSNATEKVEPIGSTASPIVIQEGAPIASGKYNKTKNAPEVSPQTTLKAEENVNFNPPDTKTVVPNADCPEDKTNDTMKKMKRQTSKGWL